MWHNHSLIKTKALQYYTFGNNTNNECTLYNNDKTKIVSPYGINVYLGHQCTYILVGCDKYIDETDNKEYLYSISDEKKEVLYVFVIHSFL